MEAKIIEGKRGEIFQVGRVVEYGVPESRLNISYNQELTNYG